MTVYADLSIPLRSLVILACFLLVCAGGMFLPIVWRRKSAVHKVLVLAGAIANAVLLTVYTAQARAELTALACPAASVLLCAQPIWHTAVPIFAVAVYYGYLFRDEWRYRENTITRASIKEGVDRISSGLCFYEEGGRVILTNSRMNDLSHALAGRELQNAQLFWERLSGGEVRPGAERLSYGSYPNFRLQDGSVWTFMREKLDGFYQLTAADTTLQQSLTDELREKNLDLAAMNVRLRRYGENVDELARAKERLETKVRIHGELGQALLATRRFLADADAQEPPIDIWRRNIAMLRKEMETEKTEDPLNILKKAAHSAGITLHMSGELPEKTELRQFFLTAASEAMTNAVFHANAKALHIELTGDAQNWKMRITNDGERPDTPITEGGGLGSLRRKAEYIGMTMAVEREPEFALVFEYGKER